MTQKVNIDFSEEERILLVDALEILSPEEFDAQDALEVLTQRVIGMSEEAGDVQMELDATEINLIISAMEVVDPDDFEMQDLAEDIGDRMLQVQQGFDEASPDM